MSSSFPRITGALTLPAPGSFRTLSRSLAEMAAITGVVIRLGRSLLLAPDAASSPLLVWAVYLVGAVFLLGMTAVHLSNFTVRRWLWRAPAFAVAEVAAELMTSALLIAVGREPWGTGVAEFHDWPTIAAAALLFRTLLVLPFALALAAVVQAVRVWSVRGRHEEAGNRE